jgi:hypothetical protein
VLAIWLYQTSMSEGARPGDAEGTWQAPVEVWSWAEACLKRALDLALLAEPSPELTPGGLTLSLS